MKEREGGERLKSKNQLFYDLDFASGPISTFSVGGVLIWSHPRWFWTIPRKEIFMGQIQFGKQAGQDFQYYK